MTTASLPSGKWARTTYIALDDVSARYSFDVSEMDIDRQNYTPSPPTRDASFRHRSARHGSAAKPILAAGNDIPLDDMAARTLPSAQHGRASKTVKISSCESLCAWKVELCASFVSICAMVALVMLLKSYDNRPLTAWTWRAVSLNAMIAILSTCIRVSSMLPVGTSLLQMRWLYARRAHVKKWHGQRLKDLDTFDNASRGPLGSLTMLLTLKPQISSVGAILMVLALGFDVFSQQVLTIRSESAVIDQAPGISTVEILERLPDVGWTGAMYNAIYSAPINNTVEPCTSGNCSWPPTPTLGVCGQCNNISSLLTTTCNETTRLCNYTTPYDNVTYSCDVPVGPSNAFTAGITIDLPIRGQPVGNWSLFDRRQQGSGPIPSMMGGIAPNAFQIMAVGPGSGLSLADRSNTTAFIPGISILIPPVAAIDIINTNWYTYNGTNPVVQPGYIFDEPSATQCGLWLCLQSRQVTTIGGVQQDRILDTWSNFTLSISSDFATLVDTPDYFGIGNRTFGYSGQAAQTTFCSATTDNKDAVNDDYYFSASATIDFTSPFEKDFTWGALAQSIRGNLESNGNLDDWIQQLATSLTNQLRSLGNSSSDIDPQYLGNVYGMVAYIHIRWAWLTMPIAMIVTSSVFLCITIVRTAQAQIPAWKGSPLNTLFCRVDDELERLVGTALDTDNGVVKKIGHQPMALQRDEAGKWSVKLVNTKNVVDN